MTDKIKGLVVQVINKNSKYFSDIAIIEYEPKCKYSVISLQKTPIKERFIYDANNIVHAVIHPHKTYTINKKDVVHLNYTKIINLGYSITGKLLLENIGLTKNQIELKY